MTYISTTFPAIVPFLATVNSFIRGLPYIGCLLDCRYWLQTNRFAARQKTISGGSRHEIPDRSCCYRRSDYCAARCFCSIQSAGDPRPGACGTGATGKSRLQPGFVECG